MRAAWIAWSGSAPADAFSLSSLGGLPLTEVAASIASRSRLYSSSRRCSANDNEPLTAVEAGVCRYSRGGMELVWAPVPVPDIKVDRPAGDSPFAMEERCAADVGTWD